MRMIVSALIALFSLNVLASDNLLRYTEGSRKGQVVETTGHLGYTEACFEGNAWAVRNKLLKMSMDDIEKDNVRAWYKKAQDTIFFSYVDTKCMDDSLDATEEGCTSEVSFERCQ